MLTAKDADVEGSTREEKEKSRVLLVNGKIAVGGDWHGRMNEL